MTEIYLIFILLDKMNSECRICNVNSKNLINPCKCTDPVCMDCIKKWSANRTRCEICTELYSIVKLEPSMSDNPCWVIGRITLRCFNIGIVIVSILISLFIMIGISYPIPRGFWTVTKENDLDGLYIVGTIFVILWQLFLKVSCTIPYLEYDKNIDAPSDNLIDFNSEKNKFKIFSICAFLLVFATTIETCSGILVIYIAENRIMFNIVTWYYGVVTHMIVLIGICGLFMFISVILTLIKIFKIVKTFKTRGNICDLQHRTESTSVDCV